MTAPLADAPAGPAGYSVDLRSGCFAPLRFHRAANPNGLEPAIVEAEDGPVLRLVVQAGAYPEAAFGEPDRCDRCELREPDKLPIGVSSLHAFALRVPAGFPFTDLRFVAAQMKVGLLDSPLFALRVERGRLFADWRLPGAAFEHHDSLPGQSDDWTRFVLRFGPDSAELAVDGRRVTRARMRFDVAGATRFLKLGPYRDKHPAWGPGPAAIEFRDIRRTILG